jgi:HEAT repeat protein
MSPHPLLQVPGGRALLVSVALLVIAAPHSPEDPAGEDPAVEAAEHAPTSAEIAAWQVLREMRVKPLPPLDEIAPRLAAVSGTCLPALLEILETRAVPGHGEIAAQQLSIYQEDLILEAFRLVGTERVLALAALRWEQTGTARARASAIRIAGATGDLAQIERILTLASRGPSQDHPDFLHSALERALCELLERNPQVQEHLNTYWRGISHDVLPDVIRAVGSTGDPRGAELLSEVIQWRQDLAVIAMAQIPRTGAPDSLEACADLSRAIRSYLDPHHTNACQAAVLALGELRDNASIPALIGLLEADSAGLRHDVRRALGSITDLRFPESPAIWKAWYEEESRWGQTHLNRVIGLLDSRDDEKIAEGLREASLHSLHRHELSAAIFPVLEHDDANYRVQACRMLGKLDSPVSIPSLIERLDDREVEVRESALEALRGITGRDLPLDGDAWATEYGH